MIGIGRQFHGYTAGQCTAIGIYRCFDLEQTGLLVHCHSNLGNVTGIAGISSLHSHFLSHSQCIFHSFADLKSHSHHIFIGNGVRRIAASGNAVDFHSLALNRTGDGSLDSVVG